MNDTPTPRTDARKASFALDTIRQLESELAAVTDQRDRLADALERIAEYQGVDDEDPKTMAIEALQSLNQAAVEGGADE